MSWIKDIEGYDYIIGGIHFLNNGPETDLTVIEVRDRFMRFTEQLITSGIDILAHPFRYFRRRKLEVPREFFKPIARLLAKHSVAAEINYHTNSPDPEFFSICLELDIKLSIASDAHKLLEVGELKPHLEFLEMLGVTDQLDQVLWKPPFREVQ